MSSARDLALLSEFSRLVKRHKEGVINLDEQFSYKFEFFVDRCENIIQEVGTNIPPHKWSYHRIGLITKGSADYTSGIYKFHAEKNTLIFVPAKICTTSKWTEESEGYLTLFNLDFLILNDFSPKFLENKKVLSSLEQPYFHLNKEQAAEVVSMFETMLKEKEQKSAYKNEVIAVKLAELILFSERLYEGTMNTESSGSTHELVKKFADLVEEHFMHERSVSFYASQLHVHPNHLNAILKSKTGITAKESILSRLLLEAKYLLHNTELTIKEISNQLGFDDPNYFAVVFKRLENISPQEYRASFI